MKSKHHLKVTDMKSIVLKGALVMAMSLLVS